MFVSFWGHFSYFLQDFWVYLIILGVSSFGFLWAARRIYSSSLTDEKKMALLASCFVAVSFAYIYSGFEFYFRYRFDQSDSLGFLKTSERWTARHVVFNNYQYRDRDFRVQKTPGVVRVGVIGDSNTMGAGIRNPENRFSNILEKLLNDHGYKVEVYNFGVSGFDTDQEVTEYNRRLKQFDVDLLVWQYFFNDVEEATHSAGTQILKHEQALPRGLITFLTDHSFFFDYLYWRLAAKYDSTFGEIRNADVQQYNIPEVFNHHSDLIASFSGQLRQQNKPFVVLLLPFMYFFPNYPKEVIEIHQRMDALFRHDGATAIVEIVEDLLKKQKQDLIASPYDSHPNEYVHRLAAEKLYAAIAPLLRVASNGGTFVK